ncbi:hypothetical protein B0H13DRAFT_2490078 [Mycena leptocephala]|nr:hypothetical protein B0H13DRAFT_2490078 [Mycena leptocephala]
MKLSIALSLAMALAPTVRALAAPFEINIGQNAASGNIVAWVSGTSQCSNAVLGPIGANFCERPFQLGGKTLTVHGCGGPQADVTSSDGTYFALCSPFSEADGCGIHTLFHCS